ncbi:hypothetical protein GIB67_037962 [Kingdonia uniflora]|uniref:UBC core domain-containing protein n=1 Tax=Kingdonia uniflora TaxID=39325 RepID=A0A7J7LHK3_9MAGN|nr:hypothetical protein GIB67_037962 [Kingdonia uniflora]
MEQNPSSRCSLRPSSLQSSSLSISSGYDPDVIEIPPIDTEASSSKKRKKNKVVPHDVIDIDGDEDTAGVFITNEKVNSGNKGKATSVGNDSYDKNWANQMKVNSSNKENVTSLGFESYEESWANQFETHSSYKGKATSLGFESYDMSWENQVKDALAQTHIAPSSATNFGALNGFPQNSLKSWDPGFNVTDYVHDGLHYSDFADSKSSYYYGGNFLGNNNETLGLQAQPYVMNLLPPAEMSIPWFDPFAKRHKKAVTLSGSIISCSKRDEEDGVMEKFKTFKQFDTVQNCSDHHYFGTNSHKAMQPTKTWSKKIQQEWIILEKDLPDSIFVRVYEQRMDLLRAVIIGAAGTPYHDGLFFFDFFFPSNYPNVPPYFEDLITGHFRERAHTILVSCKAYIEGAQVGCLAGGGVQDLEEGDKSSSQSFKIQVNMMVKTLVPAFAKIGAKGCEEFLFLTK